MGRSFFSLLLTSGANDKQVEELRYNLIPEKELPESVTFYESVF
jgi:hypothetical protein